MGTSHTHRVLQITYRGLVVCNACFLVAISLFFSLAVLGQTADGIKAISSAADIAARKDVAWIACAVAIVAIIGTMVMAKFMASMHTEYLKAQNAQLEKIANLTLEIRATNAELRNLTAVIRERPCMMDVHKHNL